MDIVKTVKQKLLNNTRYFGLTLGIYRVALEAVSLAVKAEWSAISGVEHSKLQKSYAENLIHATRSNLSPKYSEFDQRFHKFPSYLRRAAIAEAIGNVSSHMTCSSNGKEALKVKLRHSTLATNRSQCSTKASCLSGCETTR